MGKLGKLGKLASFAFPVAALGTILAPGAAEVYGGIAANDAAKDQAAALNNQASMEQAMAQDEAKTIRERARRVISQQRAALVDSGVRLDGGGSVDAIQNDTRTLSEQDALAALQTGAYRAATLSAEAKMARKQGRAALVGGLLSGAGSVIQTGAMMGLGGGPKK